MSYSFFFTHYLLVTLSIFKEFLKFLSIKLYFLGTASSVLLSWHEVILRQTKKKAAATENLLGSEVQKASLTCRAISAHVVASTLENLFPGTVSSSLH